MKKTHFIFLLILMKIFLIGCTATKERPKSTKYGDSTPKVFFEAISTIEKNHIDNLKIKKQAFSNAVKGMKEEAERRGYNVSKLGILSGNESDNIMGFLKAYEYLEKNTSILPKDLIHISIKSVLKILDTPSSFMTPKEFREMGLNNKRNFGYIGVEFTVGNGFVVVVSVIRKSPAFKAGIKKGDKILKIGNKEVKGLIFSDVKALLKGVNGSSETILVKRKKFDEPIIFKVNRSIVKSQNIKNRILNGNIGYVKINTFNHNAGRDMENSLNELNRETGGLAGLIIDLRNNPGGILGEVATVADVFLKSGLMFFVEGRTKNLSLRFVANEEGTQLNYPIVILVNKDTASGSEVLAGSLKYWKRAFIVGTPTYGQGYVQMLFILSDGSLLGVSSARIFTPGHHSIQDNGIAPDIMVDLTQPENFGNIKSDSQLQRAVNILEDRLNNLTRGHGQSI